MTDMTYSGILRAVIAGQDLSHGQAHWAFGQIMDGRWSDMQIAGLLAALAVKGESAEEIVGAALAMRERVLRVETAGQEVIDTCGTGGTGLSTFNVSTAAALVAAGAGVKVAKHGNRTSTRASGSADVLTALGVNIDAGPEVVARCLAEAHVGFCFAVRCHPAMKHAVPARKALGVRTIFNLLGPLTNPAGAKRQLMGVFDARLTETVAHVLGALGTVRAMVVHAEDGLDEISTAAPTRVSELRGGKVSTGVVEPEQFGLARARLEDLRAESPAHSAEIIRRVLSGQRGAARDIVVVNAAAALAVADAAETLREAIPAAERSLDSGAARTALDRLIAVSNA